MEVTCGNCGAVLDELPNADPGRQQPCPHCGSTSRNFRANLYANLADIQSRFRAAQAGSNTRINALLRPTERAGSFGASATIVAPETERLAELLKEQGEATRIALEALIETMRVGFNESAQTATRLNSLTSELVWWTRVIGAATIVAVFLAAIALISGAT